MALIGWGLAFKRAEGRHRSAGGAVFVFGLAEESCSRHCIHGKMAAPWLTPTAFSTRVVVRHVTAGWPGWNFLPLMIPADERRDNAATAPEHLMSSMVSSWKKPNATVRTAWTYWYNYCFSARESILPVAGHHRFTHAGAALLPLAESYPLTAASYRNHRLLPSSRATATPADFAALSTPATEWALVSSWTLCPSTCRQRRRARQLGRHPPLRVRQ